MKPTLLLLITTLLIPTRVHSQDQADAHSQDREAIIQTVVTYVDAFNERDAKALAQHWSRTGQWMNRETGDRVQGREAIEQQFSEIFAQSAPRRLEVSVDSLRFVSNDVAVEEGGAIITDQNGRSGTTYTAIHVKEDGKWKIDSIRENAALPSAQSPEAHEQLTDLEWMVGEWSNDAGGSRSETTCRWTKNRNFLTQSFKVVIDGQIDIEGTQIIGWDPIRSAIRSWVFDSNGGFGEGWWTKVGQSWEATTNQTLANGSSASSVGIYTPVDENTFTWMSVRRKLDGQPMPDVAEVRVTRKSAE